MQSHVIQGLYENEQDEWGSVKGGCYLFFFMLKVLGEVYGIFGGERGTSFWHFFFHLRVRVLKLLFL